MSKMILIGHLHTTTVTKKNDFIHRFIVGDKIVKVFSKENNLKPGQQIQFEVSIPEDSKFPMLFEQKDTRHYPDQKK